MPAVLTTSLEASPLFENFNLISSYPHTYFLYIYSLFNKVLNFFSNFIIYIFFTLFVILYVGLCSYSVDSFRKNTYLHNFTFILRPFFLAGGYWALNPILMTFFFILLIVEPWFDLHGVKLYVGLSYFDFTIVCSYLGFCPSNYFFILFSN